MICTMLSQFKITLPFLDSVHQVVRYTFLATTVFPPLRNTGGAVLELKQLFRKSL